jgi:hypothetical protein
MQWQPCIEKAGVRTKPRCPARAEGTATQSRAPSQAPRCQGSWPTWSTPTATTIGAALVAFDELASADALGMLRVVPAPARGRAQSRPKIAVALHRGGRQRRVEETCCANARQGPRRPGVVSSRRLGPSS